jgi:hypothetical protein
LRENVIMVNRHSFSLALVILIAALVCGPSPANAQSPAGATLEKSKTTASFNLDSLLIESVGGPTALEKIRGARTIYASGNMSLNGMPGTFVSYVALPDKFYLHVDLSSFSVTQAYDGHTAWQRDLNGMVSELSGYEKSSLMTQVYFQTYSYLFDDRLPGTVEYRRLTERDGKEYYEVVFKPFDADTVHAFFDPATGRETMSVSTLDNLEVVTRNSDYRKVDGVEAAFYSKSTTTGAPLYTEFMLDSMAFNVAVNDTVFSPPLPERDYHFPAGADSVVIPIKYEAGHIYVEVLINGARKLRLMLDSGATTNLLAIAAIKGLDLPVVGTAAGKGIGGYSEIELVKSDSISIGALTLYAQVAGTTDLSDLQGVRTFDGLLGYDFLSRFPILIDYHDQRMVVYDPGRFELPAGGSVVPFTLTMQVPTIEAELNGIPGQFLVDLGNGFGLMIHHHFSVQNDLVEKLDDIQNYEVPIGGVGGSLKGKSGYAASLAFGDIRIQSLRVILPESGGGMTGSRQLAGNMGNLLLEQFQLLFDYAHKRLVFYTAEATQD